MAFEGDSRVGRLFRWVRDLVSVPEPLLTEAEKEVLFAPLPGTDMLQAIVVEPDLPRPQVIEALSRQRALAEQRLRRVVTEEKLLERGRRMACIEAAKELGIHDEVTERVYELRLRKR